MKLKKVFLFVFILLLIPLLVVAQITFNPGIVQIDAPNPPGFFEEPSGTQIFVQAENMWKITCLCTELIGSNTGRVISIDRISLKHDYSGGEYQSLDNKIIIGEGAGTGGAVVLVNTIFVRINVLDTDIADTYQGELRFSDELGNLQEVILPVQLNINAGMQFTLSANSINLNVTGTPGVYEAENSITLSVDGNTSEWQIHAEVISISGPSFLNKSNIFIKSSTYNYNGDEGAGEGFISLAVKKEILTGAQVGNNGISDLTFKLKTNYNLHPGDYLAQVKISSSPFNQNQIIELNIAIGEYVEVGFSEGPEPEVKIYSDGPPGEYESDDPLTLEVAANTNWKASAEAENLKSDRDEIPKERIYLFSSNLSNLGYQSLGSAKMIASGQHMERAKTSNLKVRVETKIDDIAGDYSGKITITIVVIP